MQLSCFSSRVYSTTCSSAHRTIIDVTHLHWLKKKCCPSPYHLFIVGEWHQGYFCLGYFVSSTHFDLATALGSGFCTRSLLSCRKLHWSPFEHWLFFFPLVTNTFSSFNATQSLSILDHCSCFNFPVSGVKVSESKFVICTPLHHGFQLLTVWNRYLLMNLHVEQFQYGFELIRLTYPQFVQTFQNIIG